MDNTDQTGVLAEAGPTPIRRIFALTALLSLGVLLLYILVSRDVSLVGQIALLVFGTGSLWLATAMYKATSGWVTLTETEVRSSDGTLVANIDDIVHVERGAFAFKPTNGFVIHTRAAQPTDWRVGVWWRIGKRVGVGGMMPLHQTKIMAERLLVQMEKRDPSE